MWEIDSLEVRNSNNQLNQEEILAMSKVEKSRRWIAGRYKVAIPWKEEFPSLPDNREEAEKRLFSLEKNLLKKPEVASHYKEAMKANVEKGYIRKLEPNEAEDGPSWYLPHFPVIREDRETTKVRIVFDSAARCKGVSLNDVMLTGPKLQRDVLEILLRFRLRPVAPVADIQEMFCQVVLAEKDRKYHRLLWRDLDPTKPVDVYKAVCLTFGDRASPYPAQFVLRSHAVDLKESYPAAAMVLLRDMYMDDILHSEETVEDAILVLEDLTKVLGGAGFRAQKWCSNRIEVLEEIPQEDRATGVRLDDSELLSVKTLGVHWNASDDVFTFILKEINLSFYTKRGLLSRIATLFDPLQFLAPYIIRAKMALQEAWQRGLEWDEEFPDDLKLTTHQWAKQLPEAPQVKIPCCYRHHKGAVEDISVHTFVDASRLAYAAVSYARYGHVSGEISIALVTAKARVSPIKSISIPRLELMAAVLGLRLAETVSEKLEIPLSQHTLWTDSMDVVYWIQGHSRQLKPFVANRVAEIQRKSDPAQWRHVPGEQNPADNATRGLDLKNLSAESHWFQGPAFLHEGETSCPSEGRLLLSDCSEEGKQELAKINLTFQCKQTLPLFDIQRFSSWRRLLRVTAWILRFISRSKRARHQKSQETGNKQNYSLEKVLQPEEISNTERYWVRETQTECFSEELTTLRGGGSVSRSSPLWRLSPFRDSNGILHVGERLEMSNLPYDARHPVTLPKRHHISKLVIAHIHNRGRHNLGVNFTLAELRQKYWIVNGREEIKR